jgi:hypothetical protein
MEWLIVIKNTSEKKGTVPKDIGDMSRERVHIDV